MSREKFGLVGWGVTLIGVAGILAVLIVTAPLTTDTLVVLFICWVLSAGAWLVTPLLPLAFDHTKVGPSGLPFIVAIGLTAFALTLSQRDPWIMYTVLRISFTGFSLAALLQVLLVIHDQEKRARSK